MSNDISILVNGQPLDEALAEMASKAVESAVEDIDIEEEVRGVAEHQGWVDEDHEHDDYVPTEAFENHDHDEAYASLGAVGDLQVRMAKVEGVLGNPQISLAINDIAMLKERMDKVETDAVFACSAPERTQDGGCDRIGALEDKVTTLEAKMGNVLSALSGIVRRMDGIENSTDGNVRHALLGIVRDVLQR